MAGRIADSGMFNHDIHSDYRATFFQDEIFERIRHKPGDVGAPLGHAPVDYLRGRLPPFIAQTAAAFPDGAAFTGVGARESCPAGPRQVIPVIVTYMDRSSAVATKLSIGGDVTDASPCVSALCLLATRRADSKVLAISQVEARFRHWA
jgi:hypothetical protein